MKKIIIAIFTVFLLINACKPPVEPPPAPNACFTTQYEENVINETVYFDNCSSNAKTYIWNFGDGETSTEFSPSHKYKKLGKFQVILTAHSESGATSNQVIYLDIVNPPVAEACFSTSLSSYEVGSLVNFSNCSENSDTYLWNFGDGTTSTEKNPQHIFTNTGNFQVKLSTVGVNNTTSETSKYLAITPPPPAQACFSTQYDSYYINEIINLSNCSTNASTYLWDFGDGTTSTAQNPQHTYTSTGRFYITLKATGNGVTSEVTDFIDILSSPLPALACFSLEYDFNYVDEEIQFTNCSLNANSYYWDFGDGTTSTEASPIHIYDAPGNYTITLTADGVNSSDQASLIQEVIYSTDLDLLVMYNDGTDDPVYDCDMTLYTTENDWINFTNPVNADPLVTDANGRVVFMYLDPIIYYIDAYKPIDGGSHWGNDNLGNQTGNPLLEGEINYYNIYVEAVSGSKGASRNNYVIKSMKKVSKASRNGIKATSKYKIKKERKKHVRIIK